MTDKEMREKFDKINFGKMFTLEEFINLYETDVKPYLPVITTFIKEDDLNYKEIAFVLGISKDTFYKMRQFFPELDDALKSAKSLMKFKAQFDLQKGLQLKPASGKLLEMQLLRYDDGFKKKDSVEVEFPKTIEFTVQNKKKTDEELKQYAPDMDD